jgi:hypothetical protein
MTSGYASCPAYRDTSAAFQTFSRPAPSAGMTLNRLSLFPLAGFLIGLALGLLGVSAR